MKGIRKHAVPLLCVLICLFSAFTSSAADTINYAYDDLNRLTRVEYGSGTVIEYSYDEAGNRTQRTVGVSLSASPVNLTATAVSSTQINLSWTDNSSNETGFIIERKTGSGGVYAQIATVAANISSYQDMGLTTNTTYYYRVRAYNVSGNSAYSNEASATTSASQGCTTPPVRINGATPKYYATLQAAYDSATNNDVIKAQAITFTDDLNAHGTTAVTLDGGYSCDYSTNTGVTTIKGMLTTGGGTLIVMNVILDASPSDNSFELSVALSNAGGGAVTSTPTGINCGSSCSAVYNRGTTVLLSAIPNTGYDFISWSGACSGAGACPVTMDATKLVTANFLIKTFTISSTAGPNGSISPSGNVPANYGSSKTFTITPGPNTQIADVIVDGLSVGAVPSYTIPNITGPHTISAAFACTNSPVQIAGKPGSYTSLQTAYNNAVNVDVIKTQATTLAENVTIDNASVTIDGGYSCDYSSYVGTTSLQGMLQTTASGGALTIQNFVLTQ